MSEKMKDLIKFTKLFTQLTPAEKKSFGHELIENDPDRIRHLLFSHFNAKIQSQKTYNKDELKITEINDILSKKIQTRPKVDNVDGNDDDNVDGNVAAKTANPDDTNIENEDDDINVDGNVAAKNANHDDTNIENEDDDINDDGNVAAAKENKEEVNLAAKNQLGDLPNELISEVASFLYHWDYNQLQMVSKKVFIACKTINSLRFLDLDAVNIEHCAQLSMQTFPQLLSLRVSVHHFNTLINGAKFDKNFPNLEGLLIGNCISDEEISKFLQQRVIDMKRIKFLYLFGIGEDRDEMDASIFLKLLAQCPNLQIITAYDPILINNHWSREDIPKFDKLKAIYVDNDYNQEINGKALWRDMIKIHQSKLESFDANPIEEMKHLKELCINAPFPDAIASKSLEHICLNGLTKEEAQSLMGKLLKEEKNLKQIHITNHEDGTTNWSDLLLAIERGVESVK